MIRYKMDQKIMLRQKAKNMEPILRIGKDGIKDSFIDEVRKVINKRKLIKIKFLNSALIQFDKKGLIEEVVKKTNTSLIEATGNIFVLYYKPKL